MSDWGNNEGEDEFECEWPDQDANEGSDGDGLMTELQNTYYTADDIKRKQPREALEKFESCIFISEQMDDETHYLLLSLQNVVILSAQLGELDNMIEKQKRLLKMVNKVGREEISEAVNAILDAVATYLGEKPEVQSEMYKMTLDVLKTNNERLWFNICTRLAKIYQQFNNFELLDQLLTELKSSCKIPGTNTYDQSKANSLLEVLSLEIQLYSSHHSSSNTARLKTIYQDAQKLNSVINDPRVFAPIRETGGRIYMSEKKWALALEELFESFKLYQESGNVRAKQILKYVILASMLSGSQINQADTREAKVYREDREIIAIVQLREAFEKNDINTI